MSRKPHTIAERNVDRAESLYEELKSVHGCDPFAIMAKFAKGDAVGLGLMTAEARRSPRRLVKRKVATYDGLVVERFVEVPSGADAEMTLIPASIRFQAAKELAGYCRPKLAATTFLGADGKVAKSNVIVYVPDNGRGPS
jgi:hypothetical protein